MSDGPAVIAKNLARVPTGELSPHPRNPRRGNVEAIRESIRANGYFKPILAQRGGTIIAGHHAWLAAIEEGIASVPVVWLDVDDDTALRIMLADNRTSDLATYDDVLLVDALGSLDALSGSGYDDESLESLRSVLDKIAGFTPVSPESQSNLGRFATLTCPACGHEFSNH